MTSLFPKISLAFLLLPLALLAQRPEASREIRKQQPWTQGQQVEIDHRMGDLIVRGTAARQVEVFALVRTSASSQAEAEKLAAAIDLTVEVTPGRILIRTRYPEDKSWFGMNRSSYSARLEIALPSAAFVKTQNAFGKTELSGIRGGVAATNRNGSLRDADGAGAHRLANSFGSVDVSNIQGPVTVSGGNGAVNVTNAVELQLTNRFGRTVVQTIARNATVETNNGAIEVFDVGGNVVVNGSFGAATAARVKGTLTLHNRNGNVDVRSVAGQTQLVSSFGSLAFSDMGAGVTVQTSNGKVTGMKTAGPVEVRSTFGGVELTGMQQGARVYSGNAPVTITDAGGEAWVENSFGLVSIQRAAGAVTVVNQNGAVRIEGARAGVNAKTSFGQLEVQGAGGPVDLTANNGSITLIGLPAKCVPVAARASFGAIRATLPAGAGYDLSAATTFGKIKSDFELTVSPGSREDGRLEGKISGGGCPLRLVNSNGSIEVLRGR